MRTVVKKPAKGKKPATTPRKKPVKKPAKRMGY